MSRKVRYAGAVCCFAVSCLVSTVACVGDDPVVPPAAGDASANDASVGALCDRYCAKVITACTGDNRQYRDEGECQATCKLLPPGPEGDKSSNSVNCRLAQAELATTEAQCNAAGPFGGGVCGSRCDGFCEIVAKNCSPDEIGANAPYASKADCAEACPNFKFDPNVPENLTQPFQGEDNLNCRSYHLILSLVDKANHCPHTGVTSTTCFARDAN